MNFILEHTKNYELYFSHQCDSRSFNRGATKNIGFLAIKDKYPNDYKDITFIFNDLDTIPFNRIFNYTTTKNVIKHYYGFEHSLGGIVVIKGGDFERVNGYPNYWSWGREDTCLQKRCLKANMKIDRTNFYKIGSPQILQLFDGVDRIINSKDPHKLDHDNGSIGLSTIHKLKYTIDEKSTNVNDHLYSGVTNHFNYINIHNFFTETAFENDQYFKYDLREPIITITDPQPHKRTNDVVNSPTNWSNISYYPTTQEKKNIGHYNKQTIVTRVQQPQRIVIKPSQIHSAIPPPKPPMRSHTQRKRNAPASHHSISIFPKQFISRTNLT